MPRLLAYVDDRGKSHFEEWFNGLNELAAAKVTSALARLELGNPSNVKSVGAGVFERKIDFGPGYRVYFAKDSATLLILLGGGSKKRQSADIAAAKQRWEEYKIRKLRKVN